MAAKTSTALFRFDTRYGNLVAGCDEAGRGCFAGPLVSAAVLFDYDLLGREEKCDLRTLHDSKKLTAKAREHLYPLIRAHASSVAVVTYSASHIDKFGLHKTNLRANHRALSKVARQGAVLLSDHYQLPDVNGAVPVALTHGDSRSAAIAAASVIAKVTRDLLMHSLDEEYPGYGFASHVGYGTPAHRQAIAELGLTPQHRRSFRGVGNPQTTKPSAP